MSVRSFSPQALTFLRALKRNNDREWFKARKDQYETLWRVPLVAIVEQLDSDFRSFAPDLTANAKVSLFRIYRDTRFSDDKRPLKTQIAAVFPNRQLPKHRGAALYFHVSPEGVWIGGGLYAPDGADLHSVRQHVASNLHRLLAIIESPSFKRAAGRLHGERLQRVPRGFAIDDRAAEYLKLRQFLVGRELPMSFAATKGFYAGVVKVFKSVAPLVRFLNEPLLASARSEP